MYCETMKAGGEEEGSLRVCVWLALRISVITAMLIAIGGYPRIRSVKVLSSFPQCLVRALSLSLMVEGEECAVSCVCVGW